MNLFSARKPRLRRNLTRAIAAPEPLEARSLLSAEHVFAELTGSLRQPHETQAFDLDIQPSNFSLAGGRSILGFQVRANEGSGLNPASARLERADGSAVPVIFSREDLGADQASRVLASLTPGKYRLTASGEGESTGAFVVEVFLVGDIDGSGRVAAADVARIRRAYGTRFGEPGYAVTADANLDGRISSFDAALGFINRSDATSVRVLNLLANLTGSVISLPSGTLATREEILTIGGESRPEVSVSIDTDGDGIFDNGHVTTDAQGHFSVNWTLSEGSNAITLQAKDTFGQVQTTSLRVTRDTTPPIIDFVDLDSVTDSFPVGDLTTMFSTSTIVGRTESEALITIEPVGRTVRADVAGNFSFSNVALLDGPNQFTLHVVDALSNVATKPFSVTRSSMASGVLMLGEGDQFSVSALPPVEPLALSQGSRTLSLNVEALFDTGDTTSAVEDTFLIYLVDPMNPSETLLDRGTPGSAIFSLAGDKAEFTPGLVRYDGHTVHIDVTRLGSRENGQLIFQLLNHDSDSGTRVFITPIENIVDEDGVASPVFDARIFLTEKGGEIDLTGLTADAGLDSVIENVRFSGATGQYKAELRLHNNGPSVGRSAVVMFPDLPHGVLLLNPSGLTETGVPYLNVTSAMPNGGLANGSFSFPVEFELSNPADVRFSLRTVTLSSGANRAPIFDPLPPMTVMPGATLTIPLVARDPDGDRVQFFVDGFSGTLPTSTLLPDGKLVLRPSIDELGDFMVDLLASDGTAQSRQALRLSVIADPNTTTRISGTVRGVKNGQDYPLDGVPLEIAGFSAVTGTDGAFTILLPTLKVPSESFNIPIPQGDALFDPFNTGTQEILFRRARHDVTTGTSVTDPRQHPNLVSSFLDASIVYGSDRERAAALRTFSRGMLKTSVGNLLPHNDGSTFPTGPLENDNEGRLDPATLFASGDVRTNENVPLIALHTLFVREHNRLADNIAASHANLSDEDIYQRARAILGAMIQHITYSEYLPLLLGENALRPYTGFNADVNPGESALFAVAAFRVGHTQLFSEIERIGSDGQSLPGGPISLQNAFFTPQPIIDDGIEPYLRGLVRSKAQEVDIHIIDDVRNFLFGPPGSGGMDLPALNIQRGRDMGLPSYNQAREDFGLPRVTSFSQISSNAAVQAALRTAYGDIDKVDVWVGGIAEDHTQGAMVGPLFQQIIADQFQRTRDGDRLWYENGRFSLDELTLIRSTSLRTLILRNSSISESELPDNAFTTGVVPTKPMPAGSHSSASTLEYRSLTGQGNNLSQPAWGATGQQLVTNFTLQYSDGISTPAGADRPGARSISNVVHAQSSSILNSAGATGLAVFWGQIIDHDLGLTPGGVSDTLKILGQERPNPNGDTSYPFVAERMDLILNHPVYPGVDNVIDRPIYIPVLDTENGTMIVPSLPIVVSTPTIPKLVLTADPNTLVDRQDMPFTKVLSITEVPRELTPAALPENLLPDIVLTIQPADLVFRVPAHLTFPNRSGWAPGTVMDLWSINPVTGVFDDVGDMKVSEDGSVIETISGGIRNSSWHFPARPPGDSNPPGDNSRNGDQGCDDQPGSMCTGSRVELYSGSYHEWHDLPTYQSLGTSRGIRLTYDSLRADPRPIFHFDYRNVTASENDRLSGHVAVRNSPPAAPGGAELGVHVRSDTHYWQIPSGNQLNVDAAIQMDLSDLPSGHYYYEFTTGIVRYTTQTGITGSRENLRGDRQRFLHINSVKSPFGSGWDVVGLQYLVFSRDETVMLVDGDSRELLFREKNKFLGTYDSPPGDYSTFLRRDDGWFVRTTKHHTMYEFDPSGRLRFVTDRNGNREQFVYNEVGIKTIIDPVGLETNFTYQNGHVSSITDPADRITRLEYDGGGNLVKIVDPDETSRNFAYNDRHLLIAETNKRGFIERTEYDFAGRVTRTVQPDEQSLFVVPVQVAGLYSAEQTTSPSSPPFASTLSPPVVKTADARGNVNEAVVDQAGQLKSGFDSLGSQVTSVRDERNLITTIRNGRGQETLFAYDTKGNVVSQSDAISSSVSGSRLSSAQFVVGASPSSMTVVDANRDGHVDIVTTSFTGNSISVLLGLGDGMFDVPTTFGVGDSPSAVAAGDVNGDAYVDLIVANSMDNNVSVFLGFGDGTFDLQQLFNVGTKPWSVSVSDLDRDGDLDVITGNLSSRDLSVLLGHGDGTFSSEIRIPDTGPVVSLVLADVNGDAITDVVASSGMTLLGRGDGTFDAGRRAFRGNLLAVGDINSDGNADFVAADDNGELGSDVSIWLDRGDGRFDESHILARSSTPPSFVAISDVNDDSRLDLVVVYDRGDTFVMAGRGDGSFYETKRFTVGDDPSSLAISDVDGDSFVDLLVTNYSTGTVSIIVGQSEGAFGVFDTFQVGESPSDLIVADANLDGYLDIITPNASDNDVSILFGDKDGAFVSEERIDVGDTPWASALVDLNNDGLLDIVTANYNSHDISVVLRQSDGDYRQQRRFDVGVQPTSVDVGDVNNDGYIDVVTASGVSNVAVLLGLGNGSFEEKLDYSVAGTPYSVTVADVDGDSNLDLVMPIAGEFTSSVVSILPGLGNGGFGREKFYIVGGNPDLVVVVDLNADSRMDLVTPNFVDGAISVLLGTEDNSFQQPRVYPVGNQPSSIAAADVNGDRRLDLIVTNWGSANTAVLLGRGDGTFVRAGTFVVGNRPSHLVVADVNRDGTADWVTTDFLMDSVSVLLLPQSTDQLAIVGTGQHAFSYEHVFNQLVNSKDELGHETLYDIDPSNGNRLSMRHIVGESDSGTTGETDDVVSYYTYTPYGLIDTTLDPKGRVTDYDYDDDGRLVRMTYAKGTSDEAMERYEYDANTLAGRAGIVTAFINASGNKTVYAYDEMNRLVRITEADPDGPANPLPPPVTRFEYDASGNVTRTIDALGHATRIEYDSMNRIIRRFDPDPDGDLGPLKSPLTRFSYDASGNLVSVVDPLGQTTEHAYDARHRRIKTVDPDSGVTYFGYDADNNLTSVTDPIGNRTSFTYDQRDRLVREVDSHAKVSRYSYDPVDNLVRKTDRSGRVTRYGYDDLNRLTTETWVGSSNANEIHYTYDKASNLLSVNDTQSALVYTYDERDRVDTVDNRGGVVDRGTPGAPRVLLDYDYDANGNVVSLLDTINGSSGATTRYEYDALDRQTRLTQTGPGLSDKRVDFAYNALGQYESIRRYRDLAAAQLVVGTSYSYDELNRLDVMRHQNVSSETLNFHNLDYDDASRITRITDVDGVHDYSYDDRDQLIGANHTGASGGEIENLVDESYRFDANGNRIETHLHGTGYVTGPGNRLLSDGTYNYEYDAEGNTIKRTRITGTESDGSTVREFQWDHRNRLISVTDKMQDGTATQVVRFSYDAFDRRISKAVDTTPVDAVDAAILYFINDREDVVLDYLDADGGGPATPQLAQRYLHGPGIDEVLAQNTATGTVHWMLTDHLGTVKDLADNNAALASHIVYDTYGNVEGQTNGTVESRYGFTGREMDADVKLLFYRSRYYDPGNGKFVSEDPTGVAIAGLNRSAYAQNSPLVFTDPSGEIPIDTIADIGFILYDLYRIARDNIINDCGNLSDNLESLLGDVAGAATPYVSGLGAARRAGIGASRTRGITTAPKAGRAGKQPRLRELANDPNVSSAERGWIRQEMNSIGRGQRQRIRVPPWRNLAHRRGFEAKKGHGYKHSDLQDINLHKLQHKHEGY